MAVSVALRGRLRQTVADLDRWICSSRLALWLAVFVPLLALYLLTLRVNAANMSPDTVSVSTSAWQLAHHGTPRLPITAHAYNAWLIPSGSGHVVSNREPGLIVLAAVFYWLLPFTTIFNVAPASIAAALVTSGAMASLAVLLCRLVSNRAALAAALIAGTATTTWSVSGTSLWPHSADQLYLVLAMLAVAAQKNARAGLAFAAALLTRPPLAVVAAVMGLWQSWTKRSLRPALVIGSVVAAGLAALLLYAHRFWNGGFDAQYDASTGGFVKPFLDMSADSWQRFGTNILGTLISPGRGIFIGSPFLVVLAFGLPAAWRAAPPWARSAAVGGALYMLVHLKANLFGGGATFWSYRYPLEMLTLMTPLLVLSWREWVSQAPRRRAAFVALTAFAIAFQAVGALTFRRTATSPWSTNDITAVVHDNPIVSVALLSAGYLAAAILYRRMSLPAAATTQTLADAEGTKAR